jgi:hypothetical protein
MRPEKKNTMNRKDRDFEAEPLVNNPMSWEYIQSLRKRRWFRGAFIAKLLYYRRSHPCPYCGKSANKLSWLYYRSPQWTWQSLCGQAGWMSVCEDCKKPVDFFLEKMS